MRHDRRQEEISQVERALLTGDDFPGCDEVLALVRLVAELNQRVIELQESLERTKEMTGQDENAATRYRQGEAVRECPACGWEIPDRPLPAVDDDNEWLTMIDWHEDGCEWLLTRGHQR